MRKIILIMLYIFSSAIPANAFLLNQSGLSPKLGYNIESCGTTPPNYTETDTPLPGCCLKLVCTGSTPPSSPDPNYDPTDPNNGHCYRAVCADDGNQIVIQHNYTATVSVPTINNTCFHPTCYNRAVNKLNESDIETPVQPLTNNTATIKTVIDGGGPNNRNGLTDHTIQTAQGFNFKYSYPINDYNNAPNWQREIHYFENWETGTGTSAMQGLLWSWRMLSNKWQGYWQGQSDYEYGGDINIQLRAQGGTLPSPQNSKNIVIISDGLDSDGPDYKPTNADGTRAAGTNADGTIPYIVAKATDPNSASDDGNLVSSQSLGFLKHDSSDYSPVFETCDAHAPIASITLQNYKDVCTKMAAEGVRVNVILYLYNNQDTSNSPLVACAGITNGLVITDATPANISMKLNNLISQIVTKNIRLIK